MALFKKKKAQIDRRQLDRRKVRAGSQRRMPLERITPSRGHRPSQQNTSVRRSSAKAVAFVSKKEQQEHRRQSSSSNIRRAQQMRQMQQAQQMQHAQRAQQQQQRSRQQSQPFDESHYISHSVEELRKADRRNQRMKRAGEAKQARRKIKRYALTVLIVAVVIVGGIAGGIVAYNSSLFTIQNVKVTGVEHLTADEMTQLANVPADTTLLRVDTATIADRVKASAWVEDVQVKRIFPDTLELVVTEREMAAIVEIPVKTISGTKQWAIAKDTMWLMPIPEKGSEAAKTTSPKIYEDAENVIHIKDVPFGTVAEIGKLCADSTVNNVMAILTGMTTELADMVVEVSASGIAETTLILNNGVEVAFGEAKDIRDKERVVLEILERNPDGVSYINVRMVETPTWRAI